MVAINSLIKMKRGFTLIEMAVVLLIIGILAGIVLRNIGGQSIQARDTKRVADLRILTNYLAQYLAKQGQFPSSPDTSPSWSNLNSAFSSAGIFVNLPIPPAGEAYVYYPCSDAPGVTNHFVLRARLEQLQAQAPAVYEGSYNSAGAPSGWTCTAPSGYTFDCQAANRYYCITQ
jgi:prepilin-type N-terminal cleavage/methylation domain-containing protein